MQNKPQIKFKINDKIMKREDVLDTEWKCAQKAMKRLGIQSNTNNMDQIRDLLVKRKIELGHEEIKRLCANDVKKASTVIWIIRKLSFGKTKPCKIEVFAKGISAKAFMDWFEYKNRMADEASLLAAHPEHYIIHNTPDGRQEVYETNGGSPFTAAFIIDFNDKSYARKQALSGYPYAIAGNVINKEGRRVGGAMHQFQDTDEGLHGILSIDFPAITPSAILNGHQFHLAIEFSNWIEFAARNM